MGRPAPFSGSCRFVAGALEPEQVPPAGPPEIAFAGRSNVGKSTLLNALTHQSKLARTSQTPGRTRQINFFDMNGDLGLVDLPGYGYAKAPKHEIRRWTRLLEAYLAGRAALRRVFLLVDARRGVKDVDHEMLSLLDKAAVNAQIVLTKIDKVEEVNVVREAAEKETGRHVTVHPQVLLTSARTGTGLDILRAAVMEIRETDTGVPSR